MPLLTDMTAESNCCPSRQDRECLAVSQEAQVVDRPVETRLALQSRNKEEVEWPDGFRHHPAESPPRQAGGRYLQQNAPRCKSPAHGPAIVEWKQHNPRREPSEFRE